MDPVFSHNAFPLDGKLVFNLFGENVIFRKDLESPLTFIYFLKGKTSKNKTPKWTPDFFFGKAVCEKT